MEKILRDRSGSVLIVAVVVVMILVGLCTALLMVSGAQSKSTVISEENIRALYIAEAGINDALARISSKQNVDDFTILPSQDFGVGEYAVIADFRDYATITVADDRWFLTSVGTAVKMAGAQIIQAIVDSDVTINPACTETVMMRGVNAVMAPRPNSPFTHALFGNMDVALTGSVFADSYDSDIGTGIWEDQAVNTDEHGNDFAGDNGSIGSNEGITIKGSVVIHGDARPGPDFPETDDSSPASEVYGITAPTAEVRELDPVIYDPPIPIGGTSLADEVAAGDLTGTYRFGGDISWPGGDITIAAGTDVTIYIDDSFKMTGGSIVIPDGSSLTIYHGGGPDDPPTGEFTLGGNGIVNIGSDPTSFVINSATTGEINLSGNAAFYGAINAPYATFYPRGTPDIYGAVVAGEIKINGNPAFHYDEALGRIGMGDNGYYQVSWLEFVPVRR